jgi:hypothetical protein
MVRPEFVAFLDQIVALESKGREIRITADNCRRITQSG